MDQSYLAFTMNELLFSIFIFIFAGIKDGRTVDRSHPASSETDVKS